ncbi:hypothetical protein ACFL02_07025 [Planctomycetota bacterium]
MIKSMFNFMGRKKSSDNFSSGPGQGDQAHRQSAATVMMALVLGATLLGAWMLVVGRSGKYQDLKQAFEQKQQAMLEAEEHRKQAYQQAEEKAAQLIKKVAQQGLVNVNYLGKKPIARYFLMENSSESTGFFVLNFEPTIQQDGSWAINGKQIAHYKDGGMETVDTFSVANDLSSYEFETVMYNLSTGQSRTANQSLSEGRLSGYFITEEPDKWPFENVDVSGVTNLIMPVLLDFFSSVAALEGDDEGMVLAFPAVGERRLVGLDAVWVRRGGEAPEEVKSGIVGGHSVEVEWLTSERFQTIYYDGEHQLVWQKDEPEPESFFRAVTREQLIETFPEAEQILNRLLQIKI